MACSFSSKGTGSFCRIPAATKAAGAKAEAEEEAEAEAEAEDKAEAAGREYEKIVLPDWL